MTWKRLEGSGVSIDLTPGLEAHVADPLWLLARQWQTGEFAAEDAASPVEIVASAAWQPAGEVRLASRAPQTIEANGVPLEAMVECESGRHGPSRIRLAAEAGLQLLRLARSTGAGADLLARLQRAYPLTLPPDDGLDARGRLELRLLALRSFDGFALADALAAGARPDPAIAKVSPDWLIATTAMQIEPRGSSPDAWDSERMEYRFSIAAPTFNDGIQLEAREYPGGRLDWQAFDIAATQSVTFAKDATTSGITTIPVPLTYPGMPASRFWTFEDGAVYWGDIQGGPEDLARYLVAAFATVNGNDWYLVPIDLPRGVLAQASTIVLRDSFGRRHEIRSTAALDYARVQNQRRFRVFELTGDVAPASSFAPRLLLPATLATHEEGEPREEVLLLRDEAANLAWAVERVIESPAGRRAFRGPEGGIAPSRPEPAPGAWGYELSKPVPQHFVPLVPVRLDTTASIRLQRGRTATATGTTGALGLLLEPDRRLLLHEEEVPASGVRLTRAYQLCRSPDGAVHLWSGRRKTPGATLRGPGLVHDVLRTAEEKP